MNQELDYAEMLEIPVSTVNVVKKKGLNLFKRKAEKELQPQDDLKELVVGKAFIKLFTSVFLRAAKAA